MTQQALTGVFYQVQHLIESLGTAMIRIGHHRRIMRQTKLRQPSQLRLLLGWTVFLHQRQVVPIHHQNQVVVRVVAIRDLSRPQV